MVHSTGNRERQRKRRERAEETGKRHRFFYMYRSIIICSYGWERDSLHFHARESRPKCERTAEDSHQASLQEPGTWRANLWSDLARSTCQHRVHSHATTIIWAPPSRCGLRRPAEKLVCSEIGDGANGEPSCSVLAHTRYGVSGVLYGECVKTKIRLQEIKRGMWAPEARKPPIKPPRVG